MLAIAPGMPNAFLCDSQPKMCKSVKSFTHSNGKIIFNFFCLELGAPCTGGRLDFADPAHPLATPLRPHLTIHY